MKTKRIIAAICLSSLLFIMGCATGLTMMAPRVEDVEYGEKGAGEEINVVYSLNEDEGAYTLTRQPHCKETVEEINVSRKRPRGFIIALCEIPLYGLGIVDYLVAKVYANSSREELGRTTVDSGEILSCGGEALAANKTVVLQCPDTNRIEHLLTDDSARIPIETWIHEEHQDHQINLFVKEKGDFLYISTIDKTHQF